MTIRYVILSDKCRESTYWIEIKKKVPTRHGDVRARLELHRCQCCVDVHVI